MCVEMITMLGTGRRILRVGIRFFGLDFFGLGRGQNRRHQIGEALADAGARLDDQVLFGGNRSATA